MNPNRKGLKEPFCAVSHLIGALLSVVGLIALLVSAHGKPLPTVAVVVYGITLIVLYSLSTLYHSLNVPPGMEKNLQRLDHIAIFLLIAGTYTPVCLITLRATSGLALLSAIWGLALLGITAILFWRAHPHWIRVVLYVLMGWLAVTALPALLTNLGMAGMLWMIIGGAAYTVGIIFYAMEDRRPRWLPILNGHEIWHIFVLTGSLCHFVLILWFVTPKA